MSGTARIGASTDAGVGTGDDSGAPACHLDEHSQSDGAKAAADAEGAIAPDKISSATGLFGADSAGQKEGGRGD
jgi:hypothetical protein